MDTDISLYASILWCVVAGYFLKDSIYSKRWIAVGVLRLMSQAISQCIVLFRGQKMLRNAKVAVFVARPNSPSTFCCVLETNDKKRLMIFGGDL